MPNEVEELVVTEEGYKELIDRLEYLKTKKRYEVAERIKRAREFGDLSENAEYDEAKDEQGFVEGEIKDLEAKLKNIKVIKDADIDTAKISIGCNVKLRDVDYDEIEEYRIVGAAESNIKERKLSNLSPVGQGLIGHSVGETVSIQIPAGTVNYEIIEITR